MRTTCSCGESLLILGSKKGAYCPTCDRTPQPTLSDLGRDLINFAAGMGRLTSDIKKSLADLEPRKECELCKFYFTEKQLTSLCGELYCTGCLDLKKETN